MRTQTPKKKSPEEKLVEASNQLVRAANAPKKKAVKKKKK
jgi:hypothetical protein